MRRWLLLAAVLLCAQLGGVFASQARQVVLKFAAAPADLSPVGHSWIIIEVTEDDGTIHTSTMGWTSALGDIPDEPNILQKIDWWLSALGGGKGVPVTEEKTDSVWFSTRLDPSQEAAVNQVISEYSNPATAPHYDFTNTCVTFNDRVATAAGLRTPDIENYLGLPVVYEVELAGMNLDKLYNPASIDNIDLMPILGETWSKFITGITNLDAIAREAGWKAYQAHEIFATLSQVRMTEDARAISHDLDRMNNDAIAGKESQFDREQRQTDERAGVSTGNYGLPPQVGNGSSSGPTGGANCTADVCVDYSHDAVPRAIGRSPLPLIMWPPGGQPGGRQPGQLFSIPLDNMKVAASSELAKAGYLAASLQPGDRKAKTGYEAEILMGFLVAETEYHLRIYLANRTKRQLTLTVSTLGSMISAQWASAAGAAAIQLAQDSDVPLDVTVRPHSVGRQDLQVITIQAEHERPFSIILQYNLLANPTVVLSYSSGPVRSPTGKGFNEPEYALSLGPAPLGYHLTGTPSFIAQGEGGRSCSSSSPGKWMRCEERLKNDHNVAWGFTIQGLEETIFRPGGFVYASATLTATYMVYAFSPVLYMIDSWQEALRVF